MKRGAAWFALGAACVALGFCIDLSMRHLLSMERYAIFGALWIQIPLIQMVFYFVCRAIFSLGFAERVAVGGKPLLGDYLALFCSFCLQIGMAWFFDAPKL